MSVMLGEGLKGEEIEWPEYDIWKAFTKKRKI
jgi:hypothetical protein